MSEGDCIELRTYQHQPDNLDGSWSEYHDLHETEFVNPSECDEASEQESWHTPESGSTNSSQTRDGYSSVHDLRQQASEDGERVTGIGGSVTRREYWASMVLFIGAILDLADHLSDYSVMFSIWNLPDPYARKYYLWVFLAVDTLPGFITARQFYFSGFGRKSLLLANHFLNTPVLTLLQLNDIKVRRRSGIFTIAQAVTKPSLGREWICVQSS